MNTYVIETYKQAKHRLLLLDYDGTLVGFKPTPPEAVPTTELLDILGKLARDHRNKVIIISGRGRETLESWLGKCGVTLIAEHGFFTKEPGQTWQSAFLISDAWKNDIMPIMAKSVGKLIGSFIEEKATALVWHYRQANPKQALKAHQQLLKKLVIAAKVHDLAVTSGSKIIEVRLRGINKGKAAEKWSLSESWDFILAAGDDATDEDLFGAMPSSAHTIKIGPGPTAARATLPNPEALLKLLKSCSLN